MLRKVKAKVSHGKLELLEELQLPEGEEITIFLQDERIEPSTEERFIRSAGGWKGLVDADALLRDIQESRKVISPPVDL